MKKAEIIIIGGGVIGASVAYHLTERGAKDVLILERENRQGLGSTGKASLNNLATERTEKHREKRFKTLCFLCVSLWLNSYENS